MFTHGNVYFMSTYQDQMEVWKERREQISRLRISGISCSDLGKQFGISRQRVHKIVQAFVKNRANGAAKSKKRRVPARSM
jgi:transposase